MTYADTSFAACFIKLCVRTSFDHTITNDAWALNRSSSHVEERTKYASKRNVQFSTWCGVKTLNGSGVLTPGPRFRGKRTLDTLCGNERFANALTRTLMDGSRPLLSSTEPLVLGDGPTWQGVTLKHGRFWGAHTVYMRAPLSLRCDPENVHLGVHMAFNNTEILFDWEARESILG